MYQPRRQFDNVFKLQVVQMVKDQGLSISKVCDDMNCSTPLVKSDECRISRSTKDRQAVDG